MKNNTNRIKLPWKSLLNFENKATGSQYFCQTKGSISHRYRASVTSLPHSGCCRTRISVFASVEYHLGHPKYYVFVLRQILFTGSKYPEMSEFKFENNIVDEDIERQHLIVRKDYLAMGNSTSA